MTDKHINYAKHCIGLEKHKTYIRHGKRYYRPYRNYFSTGSEHQIWDDLVKSGYAEKGEANRHGGFVYSLTRKGLDWLGNTLEIVIHDEVE